MSTSHLIFEELTIRNFMSYGNAPSSINLNLPGTTYIQGRNLDNTEQGIGANGVGKSVIIHALVYALYGEALNSEMKLDELVNDFNNKDCVVSVTFTVNDDRYTITRHRKCKNGPESNFITITMNGTPVDVKSSVRETDAWIVNVIGLSKELFIRLVVYDADEVSFFKLAAPKQRELLEQLFHLTILSEKAESIKENSKDVKTQIDIEQSTIDQAESDLLKHNQRVANAIQRVDGYEQERELNILKLNEKLQLLNAIDFEKEKALFQNIISIDNQITTHETEITNLSHEKTLISARKSSVEVQLNADIQKINTTFVERKQSLNEEISSFNDELDAHKTLISNTQTSITKLKNESSNLILKIDNIKSTIKNLEEKGNIIDGKLAQLTASTCPECNQHFFDQEKITDYQSQKESLTLKIADHQTTIDEHEREKNEIVGKIHGLNEEINRYQNDPVISLINQKIDNVREKLDTLNHEQSEEVNQLKLYNKDFLDGIDQEILEITRKIRTLNSTISELEDSKPKLIFKNMESLNTAFVQKEQIEQTIQFTTNSLNPHIDALTELKNENIATADYTKINHLKELADHQQYMVKILTDKKSFIRKALVSKRLPYLNERLKHYLLMMQLPYNVEFLSDLTPAIRRRGVSKGFANLSHGQRARVNFALSFAFRDVLEQMHKRVNICILDEVLDRALCNVGALSAVNLITEKAKADQIGIYVITHKSELATRFQRSMVVTMQNRFSSVTVNNSRPEI